MPVRSPISRRCICLLGWLAALAPWQASQAQVFTQPGAPGAPGAPPAAAGSAPVGSVLTPRALRLFPDTVQGYLAKPLANPEFQESQQRHLFVIEFDKAAAGSQLDVAIVAVRTTGGLEQMIFDTSGPVDNEGRLPLQLNLPRQWPVGHYELRLGVNKRVFARLPYKVRAAAPRNTPIKAASDIAIVVVDAQDKQTIIASPKANQRHLYFVMDTSGSRTDGASVTWKMTALATSGGNNIEVGGNTTEDWPLENTRLAFDLEMPRDWPTGKYRVETRIDGQLLSTLHFDIQP